VQTRSTAFRVLTALTLPTLILLTAGCSSSHHATAGAGPSTPSTPGPATSSSPTSTVTTSPPPGASSSSPATSSGSAAGPVACAESQLRASIDPRHIPGNDVKGTDGRIQHAVLVDFANTSATTCTLYGYPGAAIVDASGHQLQQAKRTLRGPLGGLPPGTSGLPTVTLAPRGYAAAFVEGEDQREIGAAQAGCDAPKYPRILITPPNTKVPVPFTVGWPKCYSFQVHPVRAVSAPS